MPKILPGQTDLYALTDSRLSRGRPLEEVGVGEHDLECIQVGHHMPV